MATVTVLSLERMLEIEAETVVSGYLTVDEDLVLVRRDGVEIQAGNVTGATSAAVAAALAQLDVVTDQYVAGGLVDVNGDLILSRNGGGQINAGSVIGPQGVPGPPGPPEFSAFLLMGA